MHIKAFKAKIFNYKTPYLRQNQNKTNMADNLPTIFMHYKKIGVLHPLNHYFPGSVACFNHSKSSSEIS